MLSGKFYAYPKRIFDADNCITKLLGNVTGICTKILTCVRLSKISHHIPLKLGIYDDAYIITLERMNTLLYNPT